MSRSRLRKFLWLVILALGVSHAFYGRYAMNPDGISYIEMGKAYLRYDWQMALNTYWSPLYPLLLALAIFIIKPTSYFEFPVVHLVNFFIYVVAFIAFGFFLRELIRYRRELRTLTGRDEVYISDVSLEILGYLLFLVSSLNLISLTLVTPDMLVAASVFSIAAIILHMYRGYQRWYNFVALGVLLALGYFAKAMLFPLAFIFLGVAAFTLGSLQRAISRIGLALVVFLGCSLLLIVPLSSARGRLTFGESGKLVYALQVNSVGTLVNWQGEGDSGTPIHPTRKIFDHPAIYEFKTPIGGSYAPWYNPVYWNEGMRFYISFQNQLRASVWNAGELYRIFIVNYSGPIIGFLIFLFAADSIWLFAKRLRDQWIYLVPSVTALGLYFIVSIRDRYIAPFTVLLWLGIFASVSFPASQEMKQFMRAIVAAMIIMLVVVIGLSSLNDMYQTFRIILFGEDRQEHVQWHVAEGLHRLGILPGDQVGLIGYNLGGFGAAWAHLAGVKIVAELPPAEALHFWAGSDVLKENVMATFARIGVKAIVLEKMLSEKPLPGWQRIAVTPYYVYLGTQ